MLGKIEPRGILKGTANNKRSPEKNNSYFKNLWKMLIKCQPIQIHLKKLLSSITRYIEDDLKQKHIMMQQTLLEGSNTSRACKTKLL